MDDGTYTFDVSATTASGSMVDWSSYRVLPVDGVSFTDGGVSLMANGVALPLESILEFRTAR